MSPDLRPTSLATSASSDLPRPPSISSGRRSASTNPRTTRTSCFYDFGRGEVGSQKGMPTWCEARGKWLGVLQGRARLPAFKGVGGTMLVLRVPFRKNAGGMHLNQWTLTMQVRFRRLASRGLLCTAGWDQWTKVADGDEEAQLFLDADGGVGAHGSFGDASTPRCRAHTWHTLTCVVDAVGGVVRSYVDGREASEARHRSPSSSRRASADLRELRYLLSLSSTSLDLPRPPSTSLDLAQVRSAKVCKDGQHSLKGRLALFYARNRSCEADFYLRSATVHNQLLDVEQVPRPHPDLPPIATIISIISIAHRSLSPPPIRCAASTPCSRSCCSRTPSPPSRPSSGRRSSARTPRPPSARRASCASVPPRSSAPPSMRRSSCGRRRSRSRHHLARSRPISPKGGAAARAPITTDDLARSRPQALLGLDLRLVSQLAAELQPHELAVCARWRRRDPHGAVRTVDEATPPYGETLLHAAAFAGHAPLLTALLDAGARAARRGHASGCTPLHAATAAGHAALCATLLEACPAPLRSLAAPCMPHARGRALFSSAFPSPSPPLAPVSAGLR